MNHSHHYSFSVVLPLFLLVLLATCRLAAAEADPLTWPRPTREARPWAYWWWMASAVDPTNLVRELDRCRQAGLGGLHIIPIYGAKGWESNALPYLSPAWMNMLRFTVDEARRRDLDIDMTTGSGWCFGGPHVADTEANASVVLQTTQIPPGAALPQNLNRPSLQAVMAFSLDGQHIDLTPQGLDGEIPDWRAAGQPWTLYTVSQRPSGQRVKRAAPGGQGHMLNLFYTPGMSNYLRWFDTAFQNYSGPLPRALYHDSYEYRSDWAPDLFAQFERRRRYRLQDELPALFSRETTDRSARVKYDYRATLSDLMIEDTLPRWVRWAHQRGLITRNEAHGSPGNWLDLYAVADVPETEMFHKDRNRLVSKFASSAAHVAGRHLTSAETGTWLREHFTETLADMKWLLDDLFVSGVNHVFYHGTCYSPDEAPWPGWLFYASFQMNPRNPVWHDVPALNTYVARCQTALQTGRPDNDLLLYWPIHDLWHSTTGLARNLTVHSRDWFEGQPVGQLASRLWNYGYAFDYISDRQLDLATCRDGFLLTQGKATYRAIIVPACHLIPESTLARLFALADAGATVIFEKQLPTDVPGWAALETRRAQFQKLLATRHTPRPGAVLIGDPLERLAQTDVPRESLTETPGLCYIRRALDDGRFYFIANRGSQALRQSITLATHARSVVIMDPLSGRTGLARLQSNSSSAPRFFLHLAPGQSLLLRTVTGRTLTGPDWIWWQPSAAPIPLRGTWQVRFIAGGPVLPPPFETEQLASWTALGGPAAERFAGSALYTVRFDAPTAHTNHWELDLGQVCQSARVRLNGRDLGTCLAPPFRILLDNLQPVANHLEIEVTSVAANRIRDLDQRRIAWRTFHDINFVNIDYKPFDASAWPLTDTGLLGPVTLTPVASVALGLER